MVRRHSFHVMQARHFNHTEYDVGGPDKSAIDFGPENKVWHIDNFEGVRRCLFLDVQMDRDLSSL